MLFAMSPAELQKKLHDLASALSAIGLFVNPKKCSVLNKDNATPGIWSRGSCRPLEGKDRLMFLGVPLAHTNSPDLVLAHPLRKLTNSFFAMKKVLDKATTPRRTKAVLFESYISSKWLWCGSVIWPTVRSLKAVEGLKNSLLLGIFRFARDPFTPWLENVKGTRRALTLYCQKFEGPQWQVAWLTRVWRYMGHLARSEVPAPLRLMLRSMSSLKLSQGGLKPSWLSETPFHKFRLIYQRIQGPGDMPYWEWQASDRSAWQAMLARWIQAWNVGHVVPRTTEFLQGRQLVVLEKGVAALRPCRDALEGLYPDGLVRLKPWRANSRTGLTLWVTHQQGSSTASIFCFRNKVKPPDTAVLQVELEIRDRVPCPLEGLNTVCALLRMHHTTDPLVPVSVVLPPHLLPKHLLEGHLDSRHAGAARFSRMCYEENLLGKVMLTPKKLPERWALQLSFCPPPMPPRMEVSVPQCRFSQSSVHS